MGFFRLYLVHLYLSDNLHLSRLNQFNATRMVIKYSQNNPLWKNYTLGNSRLKMSSFGCTTCCISTLVTYFGEIINPGQLATRKELYTKDGLVIWNQIGNIFKKVKFFWRYYQFDERVADDALLKDPNKCIMFRVDRGYHWVSALKKVTGAYVCSNSYPYPSLNHTYKFDEIDGMAVLIKK